MLDAAVLSLCVLPDGDQVDVGVGCLVAFDGHTGAYVGIEVKGLPQQQVHGGVASSNRSLKRSYETRSNKSHHTHTL